VERCVPLKNRRGGELGDREGLGLRALRDKEEEEKEEEKELEEELNENHSGLSSSSSLSL
jgi:hypothetical protein